MKEIERQIEENFGNSRLGRIRSFCWNMTEYPETGKSAQVPQTFLVNTNIFVVLQVAALVSLTVVIMSTITFIMSTLDEFQVRQI